MSKQGLVKRGGRAGKALVGGRKGEKIWSDNLRRALFRESKGKGSVRRIEVIANTVVKAAMAGEPWAVQEIGNRMEGKATQVIGGDADRPHQLIVTIIDPTKPMVVLDAVDVEVVPDEG